MKRVLSIIMIVSTMLLMMPLSVLATDDAGEKPGTINLTVGSELVGATAENWKKVDGNWCYEGTGYQYVKTGDTSGTLVLMGGVISGYYDFEYTATYHNPEEQITKNNRETPGVVSINYVKNNNEQPQLISDLVIDVQENTKIKIGKHSKDCFIGYSRISSSDEAYGIYSLGYDEIELQSIPLTTTIINGNLTITSDENLSMSNVTGIKVGFLNVGDDDTPTTVNVKDIKNINHAGPSEDLKAAFVKGITTETPIGEVTAQNMIVHSKSIVSIENLTSDGDYGEAFGIESPGLLVKENANVIIKSIRSKTREGVMIGRRKTCGISINDVDFVNYGNIDISNIRMAYKKTGLKRGDEEFESSCKVGADAVSVSSAGMDNYGDVRIEDVRTSFITDALGDDSNPMSAGANGIYAQFYYRAHKDSKTIVNKENKMSLIVNAPLCDFGSYFSHGIECLGTACEISTDDDSVIYSRAGNMSICGQEGTKGSLMGICGTIIKANGASKITGVANTSKITEGQIEVSEDIPNPIDNEVVNRHGISTVVIYAKGTSHVLGNADMADTDTPDNGKGIEIMGETTDASGEIIPAGNNPFEIYAIDSEFCCNLQDLLNGENKKYHTKDGNINVNEYIAAYMSQFYNDGNEEAPAILYDNAVFEGFGAYENAIWGIVGVGDGYSPKVEYGKDSSNIKVKYSLDGIEYAKNNYAKISNEKAPVPVDPGKNVKTGDSNGMGFYLILMMISVLLLSGTIIVKNKK